MQHVTADMVRGSRRMGGNVKRYHTWPTIRQQLVADHTWNVLRIYIEAYGRPRPEVTEWIVYHDVPEIITGDFPYPIKVDFPEFRKQFEMVEEYASQKLGIQWPELDAHERKQIKQCDYVEMLEFATEELLMGNQFAQPVVQRMLFAIDLSDSSIRSYLVRSGISEEQLNLVGGSSEGQ
jgi:5'-deoxynucleotidase YfbR-like HD superfamily hydrolase